MLFLFVSYLDPTARIHFNVFRRTGFHYATLCCSTCTGLLPANGPPLRGCMRPSRVEAGLVGGGQAWLLRVYVIVVVVLICYRGVLLVQLLDQLLEVSLDARSQVLLV